MPLASLGSQEVPLQKTGNPKRALSEGLETRPAVHRKLSTSRKSSLSESIPSDSPNDVLESDSNRAVSSSILDHSTKCIDTSSTVAMAYPDGAVRITRTPGRTASLNTISLDDLIKKESLVAACCFAFFIAQDELFQYLPLSKSSSGVPVCPSYLFLPYHS